jgi:hypothetical protein
MMISCPEEVAYRMHYITQGEFANLIGKCPEGAYKEYLRSILREKVDDKLSKV